MRFDELLDNFLIEYEDLSINAESTLDVTSFGVVTMMKAIVNLQRTILSCPERIFDHNLFLDNSLMDLRTLKKEERVLALWL